MHHEKSVNFCTATTDYFLDIGGMLVHSVLKSNQIAQHVVADVGKSKQNGTAGRIMLQKTRDLH